MSMGLIGSLLCKPTLFQQRFGWAFSHLMTLSRATQGDLKDVMLLENEHLGAIEEYVRAEGKGCSRVGAGLQLAASMFRSRYVCVR